MSTTFAHLGVPQPVCAALARNGITEPFAIQTATLPDAIAGRDVCGRAPTGSGKTLAFGIPLVVGAERAQACRPTALVLAPTRELAEQITVELRGFAGSVRVGAVYGGVGYGPQLKALRRGVDVLVACPGRLEDLISQGHVGLGAVTTVVLDEADRMADMGFVPAVRRILDQTSPTRQTLLWSATLDGDVAALTRDYQNDPVRHEIGDESPDVNAAQHVFWEVDRPDRTERTAEAVNAVWPSIIFCRTRHGSDRLARQLAKAGIQAAAIHGGRSQRQRARALADFSDGRVHALVATDVAARGIHVDDVASVVHFDPPEDHKTYMHRSGRTARAGRTGVVVSLVQPDQVKDVRRMQRQVGLEESLIRPDAGALRTLSETPASVRATIVAGGDRTDSRDGADRRSKGRSGGSRSGAGGGRRPGGSSSRGSGSGGSGRNGHGDGRSGSGRPGAKRSGGKRPSGGGRPNAKRSGAKRPSGSGAGGGRPNAKRSGAKHSGGGRGNGSARRPSNSR